MAATNRRPIRAIPREADVPLDGEWEFQLRTRADAVDSEWTTVHVPSLWTMDPRFDRPHYTNVPMPFEEVPPSVPANNPTGVYRRTVRLGASGDRRTILRVGAAEGMLAVSVNGIPVGTSTDSHLEAAFDITDAVLEGDNAVELAVTKWSQFSYLEDQDHWWQFGISRSVSIALEPPIAIADVVAVADFDAATARASLRLTIVVPALAGVVDPAHSVVVHAMGGRHEVAVSGRFAAPTLPKSARDRSTKPRMVFPPDFLDLISINAASAPVPPEFRAIPGDFGGIPSAQNSPAGTAVLELADLEVPGWSAERPHLEEVRVELVDADGAVIDRAQTRIGFRRVEIVGRDLLINGRRVLIQGVNRHDADPRTGRVISRDRMLAELSLLKRANVNAIRCSHYPNDPVFLDLCDELGFYVVDEADVEGHAFASTIADDPRYLTEILERVSRMVIRDRNHPSVIVWSLGNETGYGAAHDAAAAWVRRFEPTRPVQYEGSVATDWHGGHAASDLLVPMYPSFAAMEAYAADLRADRPFITCEYAYSQGNSTGGLAEYWRLFETLPGLQGGFIWQFADQALDRDGDGKYRYGGDFGDEPNNGATLLNGITFADLTPKPALWEARGLFSPVRVVSDASLAAGGRIRVRSRRWFTDLSDLRVEVFVDSRNGAGEAMVLPADDIGPGEEREFELPAELVGQLRDPDALALSVRVSTAAGSAWAPAGTELAVEQVVLSRTTPAIAGGAPATLGDDGDISHSLLAATPRLCLWRAMTDNDGSFSLDPRFVSTGFFALQPASTTIESDEDAAVVTIRYRAAFGDEVVHRRRISRATGGGFVFDESVALPEGTADGLRVGVEFTLVDGFDRVEWVGLGPWENYPDRASSALLGAWSATIEDLHVPYVLPQENGTRGGVDTLRISGPAGTVTARSEQALHMNVSRHTIAQLEGAAHEWELPASTATVVHLDIAHRGVGTAVLGPDTRKPFRLAGREYSWRWSLDLDASSPSIS